MKTILWGSSLICACLAVASLMGCGSNTGNLDISNAQVLGGAIAGAASRSDDSSGSNIGLFAANLSRRKSIWLDLFLPRAMATTCGATSTAHAVGTACTAGTSGNNDMTLIFGTTDMNGCTNASGTASFFGTADLIFSSAAACTNAHTSGIIGMGASNSVTLTSSAGLTAQNENGAYVETDSSLSGYFSAKSGGLEVTCGGTNCAASRMVNVLGLHRAEYDATGKKIHDHTLNTPTPVTINGTGASKTITAGAIVLQHNLAQFEATATIQNPLTFSAGCCWPTGGQITTEFSNGKNGSETLTFNSCGTATLTNGDATATVYFTHCN